MDTVSLDYISLGQRIKETRNSQKMTQSALAEACSLSTSYIGHIERGSRILSADTLFKIANVLHVTMDSLTMDSVDVSPLLFSRIESSLKYKDKKKVASFMKVMKILADNIDEL